MRGYAHHHSFLAGTHSIADYNTLAASQLGIYIYIKKKMVILFDKFNKSIRPGRSSRWLNQVCVGSHILVIYIVLCNENSIKVLTCFSHWGSLVNWHWINETWAPTTERASGRVGVSAERLAPWHFVVAYFSFFSGGRKEVKKSSSMTTRALPSGVHSGGTLTSVTITWDVYMACTMHAFTTEKEEVMGLLLGNWVVEVWLYHAFTFLK